MKERVTIYTSYTACVEFEDLVAVIGYPPGEDIIHMLGMTVLEHFGNLFLGQVWDGEEQKLLLTFKTFAAAKECKEEWSKLLEFLTTDDGWSFLGLEGE